VSHLHEDLALARREDVERRAHLPRAPVDQCLDHLGIDHGSALGDGLDRREQLCAAVEAVLEEVGAALRAPFQQRQRVARVGMGAHRDDADLRMGPAELGRHANALVGHRRGHPDVDEHDVGVAGVDRCLQLLAVGTHGDELDLVAAAEQARERLADEEAVVGHGDAQRHVPSVTPRRGALQGGTPAGGPGVGTQPEGSASASARKSSVALTRLLTSSL
jgi:hypothetical protein